MTLLLHSSVAHGWLYKMSIFTYLDIPKYTLKGLEDKYCISLSRIKDCISMSN